MSEQRLAERMHASAEGVPTAPPPLEEITAAGRRARRTRTVAVAAAATVVVVGGVAVASSLPGGDRAVGPAGPGPSYARGSGDVPVFLDTSGWQVGHEDQPPGDDTLTGELRLVNGERCLVVGEGNPPIFWPEGYEGVVREDGTVDLVDQDGEVVAHAGDQVEVRGLRRPPASWENDVCMPGSAATFMVQLRPRVTGG